MTDEQMEYLEDKYNFKIGDDQPIIKIWESEGIMNNPKFKEEILTRISNFLIPGAKLVIPVVGGDNYVFDRQEVIMAIYKLIKPKELC